MSTERREQLKRKASRRLATAFRKVLRSSQPAAIDIEMFWPPDHDGVNFLVQADRRDSLVWDFAIPTADWSIANDSDDDLPRELLADIRALFRATWNEVRQGSKTDARAYLRLHEDNCAIDLGNGRRINDRDRPGYCEPDRKPFRKDGRSSKRNRRDGELVRRGDSLSKVKKAYDISKEPEGISYYWPDRGMRIDIKNGKVDHVAYFEPFADSICGIWIGAHAWEVDKILGPAKAEFTQPDRVWQYDADGFLSVSFDRNDRVAFIGR